MPLVSVIIPCYNQGTYIKDALDSLEKCDKSLFELIIVNDGSTDEFTNRYLKAISEQGMSVIFQENMGLAMARNNGIRKANGKYILPLDSDNKIRPGYLVAGIEILEKHPEVAVVYGNAAYFGDKTGSLVPGRFNLQRLMLRNYIDACTIIRKSVIEEVGLYETMKYMGLEDWDLWLRIAFAGYGFYYVDEIMFDYRVSSHSMIKSLTGSIEKQNGIEEYFLAKYPDKLSPADVVNDTLKRLKRRPFGFLRKLFLKKYFPAYYGKLVNNNKIYRHEFYD